MNPTLKEWRRPREPKIIHICTEWFAALILVAAVIAGPAVSRSAAADPPLATAPEKVDPGTKKLTAAHGLFGRGLYKLAATEYAEFLEKYPQHPDVVTAKYALAVCRYRLGEHEAAIKLLNEVLADKDFDQRDEALAVLGHSYLAGNDYDKAIVAFDELLTKFPQSKHAETAALNKAQVLYLANKKKESLVAAKTFADTYPKSEDRPTAIYFMALSQHDLEQPADAAKTLASLLDQYPKSKFATDATLLLGQCLEATGDPDGAAAEYQKMIAAAPVTRKADGQYSLGAVLYKAGKYAEAGKAFADVVKDSPSSQYADPARLQLGLTQLAGGKTADARATLSEVVAKDMTRANDAKYGLAQCDIADKKFDAARATLEQLAAVQPAPTNLSQILLDKAVCLMELGKPEPAGAEFAAFIAAYPKSPQLPEAMYRQAFCLHKLAKYEQSHEIAEQVAKLPLKSDFVEPAAELDAENLFLLAKYEAAAKAFEALSTSAKDPDRVLRFKLRLGQCAYFAGDYEDAAVRLAPLVNDPKVATTEELQPAIFLLGDALLQQGKHKEAAAALLKFVSIAKGDKLEAQFKLGLAQLRSDDTAAAQQSLAQVAAGPAASPWVTRALFELGQLNYKQKKTDEAAAQLTRVMGANPPADLAAPSTYLLGWVDFDAKKFPEAAAKWTQVVTQYPKHALAADAVFQSGVALREAGQQEEALAALTRYTTAYPEGKYFARARQLQASALTALKRDDEAKTILTALAADPKAMNDAVLYDLAWSQRAARDTAGASDTYRKLLKEYPDSKLNPAVKTELAEFLYQNDKKYDEAAQLLETVLADKNADPATLSAATYRLAQCYGKLNQPEKSATLFAQYAKDQPKTDLASSALLQAGLAYAAQGKLDPAEKSLQEMLAGFPEDKDAPIAMLKLGEVQADAEKFPASLQTDSAFLQKYPKHEFAYRALFGVGWAQENLKQYEDARKAYKGVIDLNNGETAAKSQFQIGETYLAEGKFEEAIAQLLAVEDVYAYPKWAARALLEAGRAFEQLKQPDMAKKNYDALLAKYKEAPEAALAAERLKGLKSG